MSYGIIPELENHPASINCLYSKHKVINNRCTTEEMVWTSIWVEAKDGGKGLRDGGRGKRIGKGRQKIGRERRGGKGCKGEAEDG